jgi:hypothetical protein
MDPTRFDRITKLFADHRLSRRQALTQGSAGLVAGALAATGLGTAHAQEATPAATPPAGEAVDKTMFLFVQSFQSGTVAAKEGADGTYTLTLAQGLGQTVYFSDRPERIVGAAPTPQFLEGLGFAPDNPPNAALVVETASGDTEIAVVELTNPTYETTTRTATYDVTVLAEWEESLELGFREAPSDLAAVAPTFGAAHLFIDDCADGYVSCYDNSPPGNGPGRGRFPNPMGFCYSFPSGCQPCEPYGHDYDSASATRHYWAQKCNETFPDCLRYSPQYGCYSWW